MNIAKNQSLFGTLGHIFAEKNPDGSNNGPMGGVYGPVNSTGLPCFFGLLLAKECGLTNPELAPAIERTSRFFAYYTGKGAIPYGEHEAYYQMHESNGKCGLAALAFELQDNRAEEQKFFAKMATAATSERENGHTGAFFNYLWSPLGAAAGGEEAAAAHFSRIRWMLDLNRRWDGGFDYDCLNGEGPNSGSQYNDFRMSTAALLLYALPLRQLHITGRGHDPARWLSSTDVSQAAFSDTYNAPARTTGQLVTDLGDWSPKIQRLAADELAKRTTETTALLPTLHALANDPNGSSRVGACFALGKINNSTSAPVLAALLTDPQNHVRFAAAEGMRYMSQSHEARAAQHHPRRRGQHRHAAPALQRGGSAALRPRPARHAALLRRQRLRSQGRHLEHGHRRGPQLPLSGDPGGGRQPDRPGPQHAQPDLQESNNRGCQRPGRHHRRFGPLPRPGGQDVQRRHPPGRPRDPAGQGQSPRASRSAWFIDEDDRSDSVTTDVLGVLKLYAGRLDHRGAGSRT